MTIDQLHLMGEKSKKSQPANITFRDEESENIFTDIVQINISQETVVLELGIRNKDNKTADVSHRVFMTLPHFLRFADVCKKTSNEIEKKLKENDSPSS